MAAKAAVQAKNMATAARSSAVRNPAAKEVPAKGGKPQGSPGNSAGAVVAPAATPATQGGYPPSGGPGLGDTLTSSLGEAETSASSALNASGPLQAPGSPSAGPRRTKGKVVMDPPIAGPGEGAQGGQGDKPEEPAEALRQEVRDLKRQLDTSLEQLQKQVQELTRGLEATAAVRAEVSGFREGLAQLEDGLEVRLRGMVTEAVGAAIESTRSDILYEAVAAATAEAAARCAELAKRRSASASSAGAAARQRLAAAPAAADPPAASLAATAPLGAQAALPASAAPAACQAALASTWPLPTGAQLAASDPEIQALELRAARAELELRAAKAEMELKVVLPEFELRALKAESELQDLKDRTARQDKAKFDSAEVESPKNEQVLVLGRYEMYKDDIIGQGGFSVVRRGVDRQTGEVVAIKSYWDMEGAFDQTDSFLFDKFAHEVSIFQQLHATNDIKEKILQPKARKVNKRGSWYVPEGLRENGSTLLNAFNDIPEPSDLFVRLIDYSRDADGQPGPRPGDNGVCYIVLELADYTLHEYLEMRHMSGLYLTKEEVFHLFRQLAQMLIVLHAKNFVHADLKPLNIMHFPTGRWKLIDMDGMVSPGVTTACDVCYTPYYCAPEIAVQFAEQRYEVDTSRLLDVWSLAMCICELVTMCPLLEAAYNQMYQQYQDPNAFLYWLANPAVKIEVPTRVKTLDAQLADLLERMLQKDPQLRSSMVEVLVHPYFFSGHASATDAAVSEKTYYHAANTAGNYTRSLTLEVAARLGLLRDDQQEGQPPRRGGGAVLRRTGSLEIRRVPGAVHDKRAVQNLQKTHRKRVSVLQVARDVDMLSPLELAWPEEDEEDLEEERERWPIPAGTELATLRGRGGED